MRAIDVMLRTPHMNYLRWMARQEDASVSRAFAMILDLRACEPSPRRTPIKECRAHIVIADNHLQLLEKLSADAGLNRSEIARRLIDAAMADDIAPIR